MLKRRTVLHQRRVAVFNHWLIVGTYTSWIHNFHEIPIFLGTFFFSYQGNISRVFRDYYLMSF